MKPWEELGRATIPSGGTLTLHRRDGEMSVRVDGAVLMTSRTHHSEDELGRRGVAHCAARPGARILVGGLGMGFTLRAVLDAVPVDACVDVAELVGAVVDWNRGPLADLAGAPLSDPRVHVEIADVGAVIGRSERVYDAILLDVDNGPSAMTSSDNAGLYRAGGLRRIVRALRPQGVLAVWSAEGDGDFTALLRDAGFATRAERVRARPGSGGSHVLWVAVLV